MKHRSNLHMGDDRYRGGGGVKHMKERNRGVRRTSRGGQSRTRTHGWELTHFCFCNPNPYWSVDWYLMVSTKEDCILEVRIMSRKIVIHHQLFPRKKFQWLTQIQVASNCNIPSLAYLLLNSRRPFLCLFFGDYFSFVLFLHWIFCSGSEMS